MAYMIRYKSLSLIFSLAMGCQYSIATAVSATASSAERATDDYGLAQKNTTSAI